jgi:hypothetical protein
MSAVWLQYRFLKGVNKMSTGLAIVLIILALIAGLVGGFFISRKYMMDYFEKNPPIDENMLRMMMLQMGQKPSERKINQMMSQMKSQQKSAKNKKKK